MSVSPISMFLGLSSQVGIDKLKRGLLLSTINVFRELQGHSIGRFFFCQRELLRCILLYRAYHDIISHLIH